MNQDEKFFRYVALVFLIALAVVMLCAFYESTYRYALRQESHAVHSVEADENGDHKLQSWGTIVIIRQRR